MRIDTHVHIGGEKLGFQMSEHIVIEAMEKYQIDYAIVSNGDAAEVDHDQRLIPEEYQVSQETALERVLRFVDKYPEKIGAAVWVKPRLQSVTSELEGMIKEHRNKIFAIKLHPFHSNVAPTDERVLPYLELAKKYQLPVISHTGGCEAASVEKLYEAAKMYPEIPFIMAHMGLGSDNKEALRLLGKADNLYGDTAWVQMETTIEAIRQYGSKKMFFGSDTPIDGVDTYFCNPKGERSMYQDYFHVLPEKISEDDYKDLMYRNAVEVFRLPKTEFCK